MNLWEFLAPHTNTGDPHGGRKVCAGNHSGSLAVGQRGRCFGEGEMAPSWVVPGSQSGDSRGRCLCAGYPRESLPAPLSL